MACSRFPTTSASRDTSSLRHVLHGAAPCPVPVKQRLIEWIGPVVMEYYAARIEGVGSFVDSETWLRKPGTVGLPLTPGQVLIGDEAARAPSEHRRSRLHPGSARRPIHVLQGRGQDGVELPGHYFTLGDVGYMDDDGYLFLTDRSANLIITGGVNVYPAEVDAVLLTHPAVGDVATIGVPDEEWGERVLAVVEPRAGVDPTPELAAELVAFCRDHLTHFKCPRSVDFVEHLPRLDNGKIYRRVLREKYRESQAN
ncbi:MAG: AMP-binding protein [Ilumatobacteraceae bacterium]